MNSFDWSWTADNGQLLWDKTLEHIQLTVIAVVIGMLISFPLGVLAQRRSHWYPSITGVTGFLYTIPSVALFAFLIPYTGLSIVTAEIGLVSYTLLILIRNIVAGLNGVPPDSKDAAVGMGYTDRQLLWRVELPLALPVIIAGLRLASVTTIGLVTVTALIGLGGYGKLILDGFREFDSTQLILGAVLSMAFAILVDGLLVGCERLLTPWARRSSPRALG